MTRSIGIGIMVVMMTLFLSGCSMPWTQNEKPQEKKVNVEERFVEQVGEEGVVEEEEEILDEKVELERPTEVDDIEVLEIEDEEEENDQEKELEIIEGIEQGQNSESKDHSQLQVVPEVNIEINGIKNVDSEFQSIDFPINGEERFFVYYNVEKTNEARRSCEEWRKDISEVHFIGICDGIFADAQLIYPNGRSSKLISRLGIRKIRWNKYQSSNLSYSGHHYALSICQSASCVDFQIDSFHQGELRLQTFFGEVSIIYPVKFENNKELCDHALDLYSIKYSSEEACFISKLEESGYACIYLKDNMCIVRLPQMRQAAKYKLIDGIMFVSNINEKLFIDEELLINY